MLPVLIVVVILWWLLARQFRSAGGTGSVLSFGKARAKLHIEGAVERHVRPGGRH